MIPKLDKSILYKSILVFIVMLISISFSIIAFDKINKKQFIYYEVTETKYSDLNVQNASIISFFTAKSNALKKYAITLSYIPDIAGNIGYEIYDDTNNMITSGLVNMANVKESKAIILDLNEIKLEKNNNYKLILYFALDGSLPLRIKQNGNLSDQQIFEFTYGRTFKNIIVSLNVILLLSLIIIVIKPTMQRNFLIISFVVGSIGILIIPPYTAPDEYRHFARAYEISEGNIIVTHSNTSEDYFNMTYPVCDYPIEFHDLKLISENSGKSFVAEVNNKIVFENWLNMFQTDFSGETIETPIHGTNIISPIAYIPQVIFILIAKLFNLLPIYVFYMARIGNVIISTLIGYLVIKKIPAYKNILFFLFFAPGLIFLRSTSSTDGFLFSMILAFIAYVIYLKENRIYKLNSKQLGLIAILLIIIALIKLPYIIWALLLLILVEENSILKNSKILINKMFLISILIIGSSFVYKLSTDILNSDQRLAAINGKEYFEYILQHPIKIGNLFLQSFINDTFEYFSNAIAYPTSSNLVAIYTIILLFISFFSYNKLLKRFDKIAILAICCIMWLSILVTFFFMGSQPDLGYIWGLQGRYILPIIPAFCIILSSESNVVKEKYIAKYITLAVLCISFVHFYQIFLYYWV